MKPEIETTDAQELVEWLRSTAERGQGFLEEQAPHLAQEIVSYQFWVNLYGVVLCVAAMAVAGGVLTLLTKMRPSDGVDCAAFTVFIVGVGGLAGFLVASCSLLQVVTAPRMVVIETLIGMLP